MKTKAIFEPKSLTETMISSMARTLWVCACADAADNGELPEDLPRAGAGDDWMGIAPETPMRAYLAAQSLHDDITLANREKVPSRCLWVLFGQALLADGVAGAAEYDTCTEYPELAENFAHYLAMQCQGHGVSWFDDHEKFPLSLPHIETPSFSELCD
jgi:hypothetical protein